LRTICSGVWRRRFIRVLLPLLGVQDSHTRWTNLRGSGQCRNGARLYGREDFRPNERVGPDHYEPQRSPTLTAGKTWCAPSETRYDF
jgi:hypothetical protein